MLTEEAIEAAKLRTVYSHKAEVLHEHNDCIRMAYEWLDAQRKTTGYLKTTYPIKHIIEKWAGRYVSQSDVEVAANLHPDIRGTYPRFNISSRLTMPSFYRLDSIKEANSQNYRDWLDKSVYKARE